MTYFDHADTLGSTVRRLLLANREERARMLATTSDRDAGCVTLYMSRHELRARLREASRAFFHGHQQDSARVGFEAYGRRMGW